MAPRRSIQLVFKVRPFLLVTLAMVFFSGSIDQPTQAQTSIYIELLEKHGMKVEPDSLSKHLARFTPSPNQNVKIQSLIQQLGDKKYQVRVAATNELLNLKQTSMADLSRATNHADPEIRKRAKKVIAAVEKKSNAFDLLHALLQVVSATESNCTVDQIQGVLPLCSEPYLEAAAQRALIAVARRKDGEQLRTWLVAKDSKVRVAAIGALAKVIGKESVDDLHRFLDDNDERVKLAACQAIAEFGDRKCLAPLCELLHSTDLVVCNAARTMLRQLSGRRFEEASTDQVDVINLAKKWRAWVDGEGTTSELNFPLQPVQTERGNLNGNTLLAYGHKSTIRLFDPTLEKQLWTYTGPSALSAEPMTNGNVLIADYKSNQVSEVNSKGEIVWYYKVAKPLNAEPLSNGNVLIAQYGDDSQALEVNRQGQIVWKHSVPDACRTVHRLKNGNTLLTGGFTVYIVTPSGKVVWKYDTEDVCDCKPTVNGNIVISTRRGRTIFLANPRTDKIIWKFDHIDEVADVFPLANGNLLVTGRSTFAEVTADKKVLWKKTGCYFGSARR